MSLFKMTYPMLLEEKSTPPSVAQDDEAVGPRIERFPLTRRQELALRVWDSATGPRDTSSSDRKTFVFLNGLESHSLWASTLAQALSERGHRFVGLDRRGSGVNRGLSGGAKDWVNDVIRVCQRERRRNGHKGLDLIGQCFGARSALGAALRHPELIERLILLSPGLAMHVDVSLPEKILVAVGKAFRLPLRLRSPISDDRFLTRDPQALDFIAHDPLRLRRAPLGDFYAGHMLLRSILRRSRSLPIPCAALFAEDDRIVNVPKTIELLRSLFHDHLTVRVLAGADHLLLFGRSSEQTLDVILKEMD